MRRGFAALVLVVGLGGCGNSLDMGPRQMTIALPPNDADAQASAEAICKPLGGTATLKGVETHGNVSAAVYACS